MSYQFKTVGSYVYDVPAGFPALGGMGLGAANPARQAMCASSCEGAGFTSPNKNNKIAKCTNACVGAANMGNCDGRCNPMYNQASGRNKCTSACQGTFVVAAAPGIIPNGAALPPGAVGPDGMPVNGNGMGLGSKLLIGGTVIGAGYLIYKYLL